MLSRQEEEAERRATLENDLKVLEARRGSTLHQHAQSQADEVSQGRFAAVGSPRVIGSTAGVASQYPAAAAHQADPVPTEPPLGIDINAMPELESSTASPVSVEAAPSASPQSPGPDVEHAAPPSFPVGGSTSSQGLSAFPASGPRAGPSSTSNDGSSGA